MSVLNVSPLSYYSPSSIATSFPKVTLKIYSPCCWHQSPKRCLAASQKNTSQGRVPTSCWKKTTSSRTWRRERRCPISAPRNRLCWWADWLSHWSLGQCPQDAVHDDTARGDPTDAHRLAQPPPYTVTASLEEWNPRNTQNSTCLCLSQLINAPGLSSCIDLSSRIIQMRSCCWFTTGPSPTVSVSTWLLHQRLRRKSSRWDCLILWELGQLLQNKWEKRPCTSHTSYMILLHR